MYILRKSEVTLLAILGGLTFPNTTNYKIKGT